MEITKKDIEFFKAAEGRTVFFRDKKAKGPYDVDTYAIIPGSAERCCSFQDEGMQFLSEEEYMKLEEEKILASKRKFNLQMGEGFVSKATTPEQQIIEILNKAVSNGPTSYRQLLCSVHDLTGERIANLDKKEEGKEEI
jgi:hypothetical protein